MGEPEHGLIYGVIFGLFLSRAYFWSDKLHSTVMRTFTDETRALKSFCYMEYSNSLTLEPLINTELQPGFLVQTSKTTGKPGLQTVTKRVPPEKLRLDPVQTKNISIHSIFRLDNVGGENTTPT